MRIERTSVKPQTPNHERKRGQSLVIAHCDSWYDYCGFIRKLTPASQKKDVEKAIHDSLQPDSAFAASLKKLRETIRVKTSRFMHERKWEYTLKGVAVDRGKYVTGDPYCMLTRAKKPAKRTFRILFSPEVLLSTDPQAILLRGAAVAELIEMLGQANIRTELVVGFETTYRSRHYESWIRVKRENTSFNAGAFKFLLQDKRFLGTLERQAIYSHEILASPSMAHSSGMTYPADLVISDGNQDTTAEHFNSVDSCVMWCHNLFEKVKTGAWK